MVPAADLLPTAHRLAAELASGATLAFGAVKRMLLESLSGTLETQMEMEARSIAAMSHTHDGAEGMRAFFEKRRAAYALADLRLRVGDETPGALVDLLLPRLAARAPERRR